MSQVPYLKIVDGFSSSAQVLRREFDRKFENPLSTLSDRFCWDYWHVPDQYTAVRTPAEYYFSKNVFSKFHKTLSNWGLRNLGCASLSTIWLSYYVDGCEQRLHSDSPHGPWAFVFSLTKDFGKAFLGGETLLMKGEFLDFWKNHRVDQGVEENQLYHKIAPKFNRLTVFDPRHPHGVSRVSGSRDPRQARLVLHGWFTQPGPVLSGGLQKKSVQKFLSGLLKDLETERLTSVDLTGTICFRLAIRGSGEIARVEVLTDTLHEREMNNLELSRTRLWLFERLKRSSFGLQKSPGTLVLPLNFD